MSKRKRSGSTRCPDGAGSTLLSIRRRAVGERVYGIASCRGRRRTLGSGYTRGVPERHRRRFAARGCVQPLARAGLPVRERVCRLRGPDCRENAQAGAECLSLFYGVEVAYAVAWSRLEVRGPYAEFIDRWTHEDFQAYVRVLSSLADEHPHPRQQAMFNEVMRHEREFWRMTWKG